jgi:UDP-glucose 4-epimerase
MRVLVTGGAGYIGSVTAAQLVDAGHDVVVVDDLSTGHRDAVPGGARLVEGDLRDPATLDDALDRPVDACLHFAALIEAGESMRRPGDFFEMNTGGSATLLRRLVHAEVPRFILSSTAAVYGTPERTPIDEDAPTHPTNAYGASKLAVEGMLPWLHGAQGLRWAALRYFNAAGATAERGERHDPETHLIPILLQVAEGSRDRAFIFGTDYPTPDGTAIRDYIHVEDLARAHVAALDTLDEHEQLICNLGNGAGFSVREVVDTVVEVTGVDLAVEEAPRREGDPPVLVAAPDRAARLLGWRPERPDLADIVTSAWQWRRDNVEVSDPTA